MKFFTALSIGLLSLNVLAQPILTEGNRIFHDSKDLSKLYYVPDQLNLKMEEGKPLFSFHKLRNAQGEVNKGMIFAQFDISDSEELKSDISFLLFRDFYFARLPVTATTFKTKDETKLLILKSNIITDNIKRNYVNYIGHVTKVGLDTLPEMLNNNARNFKLFSICYEVEGVTPQLRGTVTYSNKAVAEYLSSLKRDEVSYEELRDSVEYLIKTDVIDLSNWGEGSALDYAAAITRTLIKSMYDQKGTENKYTSNGRIWNDVVETLTLDGAQSIKKEFCIDANLKALETAPKFN